MRHNATDNAAIESCIKFFESGDLVELRATSRDAFYKVGLCRAQANISTPDAIHVMTAVENGCDVFLTNDRGVHPVDSIEVIQLSGLQA